MKKILISLSVVAAVAAVVVGATTAFFSDTETSTGNTFTAGSIDLKVDSECHYYNIVQTGVDGIGNPVYGYDDVGCTDPDGNGPVVMGNWSENDLQNGVHKFFWFDDIKPGDKGEDTISLHVYSNDAWGKISMVLGDDLDNDCTEPEGDEEMAGPPDDEGGPTPGCDVSGELLGEMLPFSMWLDQGSTPGFQNTDVNGDPVIPAPDLTEGDNVRQASDEPSLPVQGDLELSGVLADAYDDDCDDTDDFSVDGHNDYDVCQGLAEDGRMVGSTTYYLGLAWELPLGTTNEVQTDSLSGDITFEVEQHRNNPDPFGI